MILSVVLEISKLDVLNKLERILFHVFFDWTFQTLSKCFLVLVDLCSVRVVVNLIVVVWEMLRFDQWVIVKVFEVTLIDEKESFRDVGVVPGLKRFNFKFNWLVFVLILRNLISLSKFLLETATGPMMTYMDRIRLQEEIRFLELLWRGTFGRFLLCSVTNLLVNFLGFSLHLRL